MVSQKWYKVTMVHSSPQMSLIARFAACYGFQHTTSSPHFPQSNGLAERTVQTVKNILKENQDPYLAILTYRSTQLPWCGLSPAQLLMGRQLRTNLPQISEQLKPSWTHLHGFREQDHKFKSQQKANFDKRHKVHSLPQIPQQAEVWITTDRRKPTIGEGRGPSIIHRGDPEWQGTPQSTPTQCHA